MTDHPAKAFIANCETVEHFPAVDVAWGSPIVVGTSRYRVDYDALADTTVLISEAEWQKRLATAREVLAKHDPLDNLPTLKLDGATAIKFVDGMRTFVLSFDLINDAWKVTQVAGPGTPPKPEPKQYRSVAPAGWVR